MKIHGSILLAAVLITAAIPSWGQGISVRVNGDPVVFSGTGPVSIDGRVLVPLRGVLEKMGAFVEWTPATRTVGAQRGTTNVQLRIGARSATVNGNPVALDVPAMIITGSTMVPLRFVGEALGAGVVWDVTTKTVDISTTGTGAGADQPLTEGVTITSFVHDADGWLKGGSSLRAVLKGTANGVASFQIPGVVSSVTMRQISPGVYEGTWTVPADSKLAMSGVAVIGQLKAGKAQQLIQAAQTISIDSVAPKIKDMLPAEGARIAAASPSVSAVFDDEPGSGIDTSAVKFALDGADKSQDAVVTPNFISYRPTAALKAGAHKVDLTVADAAGNTARQTWSFNVTDAKSVITSLDVSGSSELDPGDVITVTMKGEPGGTASFAIGKKIASVAMAESPAGTYVGRYTIKKTDDLTGEIIVATLRTKAGQSYTISNENRIGGGRAPDKPVIVSPKEGTAPASPMTVTGTAAAKSRVRLTVEYTTMLLGAVPVGGTLSEQTVETAADGTFKSQPVKLQTLLGGKNTTYTITAVAVNANGDESEPMSVTVKGS